MCAGGDCKIFVDKKYQMLAKIFMLSSREYFCDEYFAYIHLNASTVSPNHLNFYILYNVYYMYGSGLLST